MSSDDLAQRVDRLEAIEEIRTLLSRYAATCDRLSASDLAGLFTEHAVLRNVAAYEGRPAILEYYESVLSSLSSARHHVVNSTIELEAPDRARHRGYYLAFLTREGQSMAVFGDYDDVVVRGPDGAWRFQEKGNYGVGAITLGASEQAAPVQPATN